MISAIGTMIDVARGEGMRSVVRRSAERTEEAWQWWSATMRGKLARPPNGGIVNVAATMPRARLGGFAVQLMARLEIERRLRQVVLLHDDGVESNGRAWSSTSLTALAPRAVVLEGAFDVRSDLPAPFDCPYVVSAHDLSIVSSEAHELRLDRSRRDAAQRLLDGAAAFIVPSSDLAARYSSCLTLREVVVIEPGIAAPLELPPARPLPQRVAIVGGIKTHKGGALLPSLIAAVPAAEWHLFGGGDLELLRDLRAMGGPIVHGYYRASELSTLLRRNRIALAVLPSIVPESFSLTLSECWQASVHVVAFDHGAIGERLRARGDGGWLVPLSDGAAGLAAAVNAALQAGPQRVDGKDVPTATGAAEAHRTLYRRLGWL